MRGRGGCPTRSRKRAAMLLTLRVFSEQITRLSASAMLEQWSNSPGLQLWQGRPALAQEQLRKEQVAPTAQKQQRSCWASAVFWRLLPSSLAGGAIVTEEEWLTRIVRFTSKVASEGRRLAASAATAVQGAPCHGGDRSSKLISEEDSCVKQSSGVP